MGCGCGSKNSNRTTAANRTTTTAPQASTLWEVVKGGRVIYRTRDEQVAINRKASNPGSHYRPAGTTQVL